MTEVAARELRNRTTDLLRRVEAGEQVTITYLSRSPRRAADAGACGASPTDHVQSSRGAWAGRRPIADFAKILRCWPATPRTISLRCTMTPAAKGLLDTRVFIALESDRPINTGLLPDQSASCPLTIAEPQAGVLITADVDVRARRLATLESTAAHGLPVVTQDDDFRPLDGARGVEVIRV